jgi:hypothetical protein
MGENITEEMDRPRKVAADEDKERKGAGIKLSDINTATVSYSEGGPTEDQVMIWDD